MTWIKTIPLSQDEKVRKRLLKDNATSTQLNTSRLFIQRRTAKSSGIVDSHSLIPDAMFHAFATFGSLLSPDLPLQRHQHEMIATVVSVTNRCHY